MTASLQALIESTGIELRAAGPGRLRGLCPFHAERTPSFFVFSDKNRFYCFGCHEHGDAIDFVRRTRGCGYRDALCILGIDSPKASAATARKLAEDRRRKREVEWRERELSCTLATAIRRAEAALRRACPDNFDSPLMSVILQELSTLKYQWAILIHGEPEHRAELVRSLSGLRLFHRRTLFRSDFDFAAWMRTTGMPNGQAKSMPDSMASRCAYEN